MSFESIDRFRSGDHEDIEFETAYIEEEKNDYYYIGLMPIEFDGNVRAVMCLEYNWNELRSTLLNETNRFVILTVCNAVIICLVTVFLLRKIVIAPLSSIQTAVAGFIETKDSKAAKDILGKIRINNEMDNLAEDLCEMTEEIDSYIKELQAAHEKKDDRNK